MMMVMDHLMQWRYRRLGLLTRWGTAEQRGDVVSHRKACTFIVGPEGDAATFGSLVRTAIHKYYEFSSSREDYLLDLKLDRVSPYDPENKYCI
jgi:hypothetical protein